MSKGTLRFLLVLATGAGLAGPASAASQSPAVPSCDVVPLAAELTTGSGIRGGSLRIPAGNQSALLPASRHAIDARFDPERHTITARQALAWTNPGPATLCSVYLHLDLNAWSGWNSRHMAGEHERGGAPNVRRGDWAALHLTHLRQDGRAAVWRTVSPPGGPLADRTLVRVDLPRPVTPGSRVALDIGFQARLPGAWAGFGHAHRFHLAAHWIPQLARLDTGAAGPRWIAPAFDPAGVPARGAQSFDVRLTVPAAHVPVAAVSAMGPPRRAGSWVTYRFRHDGADFAWATDPRFERAAGYRVLTVGAQPAAGGAGDAPPRQVRLRVFHRDRQAATAAIAAEALADALGEYARALSPPPASRLTAVLAPFEAMPGALRMARDGLVVLPGHATRAELEQAALRAVGAGWFPVDATEPRSRTMALGAIEYWTARLLQDRGRLLRPGGWLRWLRLRDGIDPFVALRLPLDLRAPGGDDGQRASRIALALHDLEARIGRPAFDRGFRDWLRSDRRSAASLRDSLARASRRPREVERTFAQHIAREMTVDDRVVSLASVEMLPRPGFVEFRGREVEITQAAIDRAVATRRAEWRRSVGRPGYGPFAWRSTAVVQRRGALVPQALRVTFADGSWRRVRFDGRDPVRRFEWIARSPAVAVQLDPAREVLLDESKLDDGRSLHADTAPARRWGGDAAAMVQVASTLLVGL